MLAGLSRSTGQIMLLVLRHNVYTPPSEQDIEAPPSTLRLGSPERSARGHHHLSPGRVCLVSVLVVAPSSDEWFLMWPDQKRIVSASPMSAPSSETTISISPASSAPRSIISSSTRAADHVQKQPPQDRDRPSLGRSISLPGRESATGAESPSNGADRRAPASSPGSEHVIHLSSIEHCMPRAYIRVCLAYRVPDARLLPVVEKRLNDFVRRIVDAKPYLAGYVVPVAAPGSRVGAVEVRFTDEDFVDFPTATIRHLTRDEVPYTYEELDRMSLPPSLIRPELVSALPEGTDEERAPVFRVQVNVVEGGVIVSIYLHHCISDGTGLGLLITGSLLSDDFTFVRPLEEKDGASPSLSSKLAAFAHEKSLVRRQLSWSFPNLIIHRRLRHRSVVASSNHPSHQAPPRRAPGRGCVFAFSQATLKQLKETLESEAPHSFMTSNDVLQAILWHYMTRARRPSLPDELGVISSKLLIPVNIRNRLKQPLPHSYFGSAIDFASVQRSLTHLSKIDMSSLAQTALSIRQSINQVNEPYIREAIALAEVTDPDVDVRDLLASNMDRTNGADMYITSWEKLPLYEATLDLGLGRPDWVRKPWSRDPGSCIILPRDNRKPFLEVVVQMTVADMARLLRDDEFMKYVIRVVE